MCGIFFGGSATGIGWFANVSTSIERVLTIPLRRGSEVGWCAHTHQGQHPASTPARRQPTSTPSCQARKPSVQNRRAGTLSRLRPIDRHLPTPGLRWSTKSMNRTGLRGAAETEPLPRQSSNPRPIPPQTADGPCRTRPVVRGAGSCRSRTAPDQRRWPDECQPCLRSRPRPRWSACPGAGLGPTHLEG